MKLEATKEYAWLAKLIQDHHELDKQCDALKALMGIDYDSPLIKAMWMAYQNYADAVSELVGDTNYAHTGTWVSWYIWENKCGQKGLAASGGGKGSKRLRPVRTVKDLLKLINQCKHNPV